MTRTVTAFLRKLEFKIEDKDLRIACYPLLSLRFHYACATMMPEVAQRLQPQTLVVHQVFELGIIKWLSLFVFTLL